MPTSGAPKNSPFYILLEDYIPGIKEKADSLQTSGPLLLERLKVHFQSEAKRLKDSKTSEEERMKSVSPSKEDSDIWFDLKVFLNEISKNWPSIKSYATFYFWKFIGDNSE